MALSSLPWLAAGLGLVLALVLISGGAAQPGGDYGLPLLTLLLIAEFGFFVTGAGCAVGLRAFLRDRTSKAALLAGLACAALSLFFALTGIAVWQASVAGAS